MNMIVPFDEGYLRTNPVWSIEQMLYLLDFDRNWSDASGRLARAIQAIQVAGTDVPEEALSDLVKRGYLEPNSVAFSTRAAAKPGPGSRLMGLFVDRRGSDGFVVPLEVTLSDAWWCSPFLPFRVADIQNELHRLLLASGMLQAGRVPERWSFRIQERFEARIHGGSMTIAAVIAVLDAAAGSSSPMLERGAVVVEATADGDLRPTELVERKLAAFVREHRRGTLLVRHPGCSEGEKFDRYFDHVWLVANRQELGRHLAEAGLLDPLLQEDPISQHQLRQVAERLYYLERVALRYEEALDLARRANTSVSISESTSVNSAKLATWERHEPLMFLGNLQRHLGQFASAMETNRDLLRRLEAAGEGTSHNEVALVIVAQAAALFDGHWFEEACEILLPWLRRADDDPRLLEPTTRVALLNTLGRARAVGDAEDWESPFLRSLDLQRRHDLPGLARTWNYWLLAQLRHGRMAEVRSALEEEVPVMEGDDFSRWIGGYVRAELARQEGRVWHDPDMERGERPRGTPGHPWGFYFQATARQPGCSDVERRFRLAAECMGDIVGGELTILRFYSDCLHLALAAVSEDREGWGNSRQALLTFVEHPEAAGVRRYYESVLGKLETGPSLEFAEELLVRLPFL